MPFKLRWSNQLSENACYYPVSLSYNHKNFSAIANDEKDDTAAFQAAIDSGATSRNQAARELLYPDKIVLFTGESAVSAHSRWWIKTIST